jgi:hypothetical protein
MCIFTDNDHLARRVLPDVWMVVTKIILTNFSHFVRH